jgi:phosphoglycolate phosphatase-like HAD superfamily hydrolase
LRPTVLITDFDNTLYDWFHMWHQSFSAMLAEIERVSGIDRATLKPEIRAIHQKFGTSEYAFLIEEIPSLQAKYKGQHLSEIFDDAIHAYRRARNASLQLYGGVTDALINLRSRGILIVLYTESLAFYTTDRIKRLALDDLVDFVYSPPDHEIPDTVPSHTTREKYKLSHAVHRYLGEGELKPNPAVLRDIIAGIGRTQDECVYLGDSKMKDIAMAQDAGVTDVFAEYGIVQHREEYELLRQVSHWPDTDVLRERVERTVVPTHTISQFSEIISFF